MYVGTSTYMKICIYVHRCFFMELQMVPINYGECNRRIVICIYVHRYSRYIIGHNA